MIHYFTLFHTISHYFTLFHTISHYFTLFDRLAVTKLFYTKSTLRLRLLRALTV
jgi:hypothetical protein